MNSLTILTVDKILILAPVPASRLLALQTLLESVCETWESECAGNTEIFLETMGHYLQQIADLIPRLDTPTPTDGFDISILTPEQVTELFFYRQGEGKILPSKLIELHQPRFPDDTPTEPPNWGDDIGDWSPPVQSCGDVDTDLLAMLSVAFKASGAIRIFSSYDRETINLWIKQYNAYSEPSEDRRNRWLAEKQEEYKQQNADIYRDAMGLGDVSRFGFPK